MLININFSSLNLQDHCASIVGHTSTTGRHVSLSFDFFYCHCCTSFGLWILYSFRFTTAGLHYIPTLIMSFLNKCYCWESVVHAVHRWYIPLKFIVPYTVCLAISIFGHSRHLTHSPGVWSLCSISYGSAFVNRKELASCDESAALITVELIFLAIVLYDEENLGRIPQCTGCGLWNKHLDGIGATGEISSSWWWWWWCVLTHSAYTVLINLERKFRTKLKNTEWKHLLQ